MKYNTQILILAPLVLLLFHPDHQAAAVEPKPVQLLVVYYSLQGNTERFAQGVAEGAKQVAGTKGGRSRKSRDATKDDLEAADAIALGCPTYFASIPGQMKIIIDDWNWKWKVDFTDKVGRRLQHRRRPDRGQGVRRHLPVAVHDQQPHDRGRATLSRRRG